MLFGWYRLQGVPAEPWTVLNYPASFIEWAFQEDAFQIGIYVDPDYNTDYAVTVTSLQLSGGKDGDGLIDDEEIGVSKQHTSVFFLVVSFYNIWC